MAFEIPTGLLAIAPAILLAILASKWAFPTEKNAQKAPPNSTLPLGGDLIFVMWDMKGCFDSIFKKFNGFPVRLRLVFRDLYVVFGAENVNAVWKSPNLHTRAFRNESLNKMFKISQAQHDFYMSDNSGHGERPKPGSSVPAHLRIDHAGMGPVQKLLKGSGSKLFMDRFGAHLWEHYSHVNVPKSGWTEIDDLWLFVRTPSSTAMLKTVFGERLLGVNPTFIDDFWEFDKNIHKLSQQRPRWTCPDAYIARDKCIDSVIRWHNDIAPAVAKATPSEFTWSPVYGTDAIRARMTAWAKIPLYAEDPGPSASDDLAFIWGANANLIPASFWMLAEVLRKPALLALCKAAIVRSRTTDEDASTGVRLDIAKLCADPLVQAVYAETMRMHVSTLLIRSPDRKPLQLGNYAIPKDASLVISSYHAQHESAVWEKNGPWPVEKFHPERFLFDAEERPVIELSSKGQLSFSMDGFRGSWIPYGGGPSICPGRHAAKQAMISHFAISLMLFDFEILEPELFLKNDMTHFGLGSCQADRKMPVKVRRAI